MYGEDKISSLVVMTIAKKFFRDIYIRLCKPRAYWHNRKFHPLLDIVHEAPGVYSIFWKHKRLVQAIAASAVKEQHKVCNIIGSGPSIRAIRNPRLLFDHKTICVNGSFIIARDVGANPDYYMVSDRGFIRRNFDLFKSAALLSGTVVLNATAINALCEVDPSLLKELRVIYVEDLKHSFKRLRLKKARDRMQKKFEGSLINHRRYNVAFSNDLSLGVFPSGTIVYEAAQFAYGIGFKELRIFGMDLSAAGRFYPEDVPEPSVLCESYQAGIKPGFELIKQYAIEKNLTIYNCSPHSRLPDTIIKKIDPNTILERINRPISSVGLQSVV